MQEDETTEVVTWEISLIEDILLIEGIPLEEVLEAIILFAIKSQFLGTGVIIHLISYSLSSFYYIEYV